MPNTDPVNDDPSLTEFMLKQAERAGWARVYPIAAVQPPAGGPRVDGIRGPAAIRGGRRLGRRPAGLECRVDAPGAAIRPALRPAGHSARRRARTLGATASCTRDASRPGSASRGLPGAADDVMVSRDLLLTADTGGRYHPGAHVDGAEPGPDPGGQGRRPSGHLRGLGPSPAADGRGRLRLGAGPELQDAPAAQKRR